jgi:hypothetical protein
MSGLAWQDEAHEQPFDRFPASMKALISDELWRLACQPAGVYVDFTGAPEQLYAKWHLSSPLPEGDKIERLAQSGLDFYARDNQGQWRWAGSRSPWNAPDCDGSLPYGDLDGQEREYRVYLPKSNRTDRLLIGSKQELRSVDKPDSRRPIAYYGTSIVHGAGVGRPGMPHACQLARKLDREVFNLGFCGKAYCEIPVAEALGRIDARLYIVDCLPNNSPEQLAERLPPFLKRLRELRPDVPILLVEDREFGAARFQPFRSEVRRDKNRVLHGIIDALQDAGMTGLHLASHPHWYGDDGEGTVDGSHPNDLGAFRMAEALLPIVEPLI